MGRVFVIFAFLIWFDAAILKQSSSTPSFLEIGMQKLVQVLEEPHNHEAFTQSEPRSTQVSQLPTNPDVASDNFEEPDMRWQDTPIEAEEEILSANNLQRVRKRILEPANLPYPVRIEEKMSWDAHLAEWRLDNRLEMVANRVLLQIQSTDAEAMLQQFVDAQPGASFVPVNDEGLFTLSVTDYDLYTVQNLTDALFAEASWVEFAEPDFLVHPTQGTNDPSLGTQWALHNVGQSGGQSGADIDAFNAWDIRTHASDIVVAVTDTGILYTHEDLENNMWINPNEIAGDGVDNDGNGVVDDVYGYNAYANSGDPLDVDGHGTHVAGIIGAEGNNGKGISGVAWDVQLMGVKFLHGGTGSTSDAVKAIRYARLQGADVVNASWGGGGFSTSLYNELLALRNAGIIFAAAAGNNGRNTDTTTNYPSGYSLDNIVSVGSSTRSNTLSSFSNYGATSVDIIAPGSSILATYYTSNTAYATLSGTSMATPYVAGILALLKAEFPGEYYDETLDRLYGSVDVASVYEGKSMTGGVANLYQALTMEAGAIPPSIVSGLEDAIVAVGNDQVLSVTARGGEPLQYQWYYQGNAIAEANESTYTVTNIQPNTAGVYSVEVTNAHGAATSMGTLQALSGFEELAVAIEAPNTQLAVSGDGIWRIQSEYAQSGSSALKSAQMTHNQTSSIETRLTGPGTASFWVKVSSERYYDYLRVYLDDEEVIALSGHYNWTYYEVPIPAGEHILKWAYVKDYSVSYGEDAVFLDAFNFVSNLVAPPAITSQPATYFAKNSGESLNLNIGVSGGSPLTYQWYRDGEEVAGANHATLSLDALTTQNAGIYQLWVSNPAASVASHEITIDVAAHSSAPNFLEEPVLRTLERENTATLSISVEGATEYQWLKDGIEIAGQTAATLFIANVQFEDAGTYTLHASNVNGAVLSAPLIVQVIENSTQFYDAIDSQTLLWSNSSSAPWSVENDTEAYGQSALKTGTIASGETTEISTSVNGPGTLYFSWKVSSEYNYDFLSFIVNGVVVSQISGDTAWADVAYEISSGVNEITWQYSKDETYGSGFDSGWVDRIVFAPGAAGIPYIHNLSENAVIASGESLQLRVDAIGEGDLHYQWEFNGQPIESAVDAIFRLDSFNASQVGDYRVVVRNHLGSVTSASIGVTLLDGNQMLNYFEGATLLENGWIAHPQLGYMQTEQFPWVYSIDHGWLYAAGEGGDSYWFYDVEVGWFWTHGNVYPYLWCSDFNSWFYFAGSSSSGSKRDFFDLKSSVWSSANRN